MAGRTGTSPMAAINPSLRSNPIAIVRNDPSFSSRPRNAHDDDTSSSEEEDLSHLENDMDALHVSHQQITVGSLPSRPQRSGWSARKQQLSGSSNAGASSYNMAQSMPVPRAPFLGSQHGPNDQILAGSIPPMELTEPAAPSSEIDHQNDQEASFPGSVNRHSAFPPSSVPSYGSLRDSHLQGRFLDGPASYRSSGDGRIHSLQRKRVVRFDDSATSYQPDSNLTADPASIASWSQPISINTTPGARMEAERKKRQEDSDMANSSSGDDNSNCGTSPSEGNGTPKEGGGNGGILSAMMEGGDGLPNGMSSSYSRPSPMSTILDTSAHSQLDALEMSAHSDNAEMLSISLTGLEVLSSTRASGEALQLPQQSQSYSLSQATAANNANGNPTSGITSMMGNRHEAPPANETFRSGGDFQVSEDPYQQQPLSPAEYDPDTEGAFDLEM
eukprot:CAMPEP_0195285608 /NCGR_PEP_ID=MMETSP0707-20130614/3379_1 /TAXON_ID=33640 /ORGANISM="Asterionellopsis glacialis, Strain CCMP134" /LENGTH=444 /DNA_ID=CAMNT_0040345129 /DNA_START=142 /DNA_END=1476 /DNA_ORIENTATION=+